MIAEQFNIFEVTKPKYKITKPIRLVELFAGIERFIYGEM
jgi:hypothetical protein